MMRWPGSLAHYSVFFSGIANTNCELYLQRWRLGDNCYHVTLVGAGDNGTSRNTEVGTR